VGNLGKIHWFVRSVIKPRGSIGKSMARNRSCRESIRFMVAGLLQWSRSWRKRSLRLHWVWPTGNGDLGNQGITKWISPAGSSAKWNSPTRLSVEAAG